MYKIKAINWVWIRVLNLGFIVLGERSINVVVECFCFKSESIYAVGPKGCAYIHILHALFSRNINDILQNNSIYWFKHTNNYCYFDRQTARGMLYIWVVLKYVCVWIWDIYVVSLRGEREDSILCFIHQTEPLHKGS